MTLFSTLGGYATYRGQFPLVPSTFHNVEVTAKETRYAVRNGQPTPYVIGVEEKKLTKTSWSVAGRLLQLPIGRWRRLGDVGVSNVQWCRRHRVGQQSDTHG